MSLDPHAEKRLENCEQQIAKLTLKLKERKFCDVETEEVMRHDLRIWMMQRKALQTILTPGPYQYGLEL